ncbi:MAG: hypothetical protein GY953_04895, partial [bacterium]|nr:hypothetical protein [bacterium]
SGSVSFEIEVDFLGNGDWHSYTTVRHVGGEDRKPYQYHVFPEGFSAHWVRITANADCTATAEFIYT